MQWVGAAWSERQNISIHLFCPSRPISQVVRNWGRRWSSPISSDDTQQEGEMSLAGGLVCGWLQSAIGGLKQGEEEDILLLAGHVAAWLVYLEQCKPPRRPFGFFLLF